MKILLHLLFLLSIGVIFGQQTPEFSFDLYFEDAVGNKDTITLGYDELGTQGLDNIFGEEEIVTPWNGPLEVRASNFVDLGLNTLPNYYTKKQIIYKDCNEGLEKLVFNAMFNVYAEHLPVTVKWNKSSLNLQCNVLTAYSNLIYVYNWHWGAPRFMSDSFGDFLSDTMFFYNLAIDSIIIDQEHPNSSTYSMQGKEIIVGRLSFSSPKDLPPLSLNELSKNKLIVKTYPNPVNDYLQISIIDEDFGLPFNLVILSSDGRFIQKNSLKSKNNIIDVSDLKSGVYFVRILKNNQLISIEKIIK